MASASITQDFLCFSMSIVWSRVASLTPQPGPTNTALIYFSSSNDLRGVVLVMGLVMTAMSDEAYTGSDSGVQAMLTSPAPALNAEIAAIFDAPVVLMPPPITTAWPRVYLCDSAVSLGILSFQRIGV